MTQYASVKLPPAQCDAWDCSGCIGQHNAPNPILVWHREAADEDARLRGGNSLLSAEWTLEDSVTFGVEASGRVCVTATPEHYAHARAVLTRLARLADA